MPLKPGQRKEIAVKFQKAKELVRAFNRLSDKEFDLELTDKKEKELKQKLLKAIADLKAEIAYHQKNAGNPKVDAFVQKIETECSEIVSVYRKSKEVLMRGVKGGTSMVAFQGRSWNDRRPLDSDKMLQQIYDLYLKSKGFKALRSNSIFTTTNFYQAAGYGKVYFIFPKNGFSFHWCTERSDVQLNDPEQLIRTDLTNDVAEDADDWYYEKYGKSSKIWNIYDDPIRLLAELEKIKYPKKYKLIDLIDRAGIKHDFGPTEKNLSAALKSGHEVVVSGEYYAVKVDSELAKYVLNILGIKVDLDNGDVDDPFLKPFYKKK